MDSVLQISVIAEEPIPKMSLATFKLPEQQPLSRLQVKDKIVLVTGGGRGIGRAIVSRLHSLGAKVVFSFASNRQAAADLTNLDTQGDTLRAYQADVADLAAMKELVAATINDFGRVDALVHSAGVAVDKALMLMSEDDWRKVLDTNLTGAFNACRSVIIPMMKQKYGRIVNISSVSGLMGLAGQVNYAASKAGVCGLTRSLAKEVAAYGITVNAVAPGFIETDMVAGMPEKRRQELEQRIPAQRFGSADEVAELVCYLLSDQAAYITGQTLVIDGGLSLG
jgi:3-oxoacyl-[acyl-carrier protein] reductase